MIIDVLHNAYCYFTGQWWREAVDFIRAAGSELGDGERPIRGQQMFARVLSYTTGPREDAVLESHRRYMDIQVVLTGQETVAVWPAETLSPLGPYDVVRDVTLYEPPTSQPVTFEFRPGYFAVFLPQDAHMPQLVSRAPCRMKKVVVKVAIELVGSHGIDISLQQA